MFTSILVRLGLGWLGASAVPVLISLALGGGGLAAWGFDWTDYKTAILGVVVIGASIFLIYVMVTTQSQVIRAGAGLVLVVLLVVSGYYKGRIDEALLTDEKVLAAEIAVHKQYRAATNAELARVAKAKAEAEAQGEAVRVTWTTERDRLRAELKRLQQEAANATNAKRPAFDLPARKRLNCLRRKPGTPGLPSDCGKAETGETPVRPN